MLQDERHTREARKKKKMVIVGPLLLIKAMRFEIVAQSIDCRILVYDVFLSICLCMC